MATEVVRTVGSGGDYSTLALFSTGERRDLVSTDEIAVAEIIGGTNVGNPTGSVSISSGWTTDETRRIVIRPQSGSGYAGTGALDTSKAYLQGNSTFFNNGQIVCNQHLTIQGIQMDLTATFRLSHNIFFFAGGGSLILEDCLLIHETDASVTGNNEGANVEIRNPSGSCRVQNSVLIDKYTANSNNSTSYFVQGASASQTFSFWNNTILSVGGNGGSKTLLDIRNGHVATTQNNYLAIPSNSTGGIYVSSSGGAITKGANDATSNTEATTAALQSIPYSDTTFTDVSDGAENLLPNIDGALYDAGADLSSFGVTTDILGTAIPQNDAPDIGAYETTESAIVPFIKSVDSSVALLLDIDSAHAESTAYSAGNALLLDIDAALAIQE